jgi:hypothetical protein
MRVTDEMIERGTKARLMFTEGQPRDFKPVDVQTTRITLEAALHDEPDVESGSTSAQAVPQMKKIVDKMMESLERYPSTQYTAATVDSLDKMLGLIDRCESPTRVVVAEDDE